MAYSPQRLREAVESLGVSVNEAARLAGMKVPSQLRGYLSGKHQPGARLQARMESAWGLEPGFLSGVPADSPAEPTLRIVTVSEARQEYVSRAERALDFVPVRYVDGEIAAGPPRDIEENVKGYCVIYRSWCKNPEDHVCIKVSGSSMAPIIGHGYIVAIDLSQRDPEQLNGEIVAVANDEGATLRRLRVHEGGAVGVPENWSKAHPVLPIGGRDGARIVGRATWWWGHQ